MVAEADDPSLRRPPSPADLTALAPAGLTVLAPADCTALEVLVINVLTVLAPEPPVGSSLSTG